MPYFTYTQEAIDHLKAKDPILAQAIDQIGPIQREIIPDLFEALVNAIVGQQIATKAQITIWNRMKAALGAITPQSIAALSVDELQAFGISFRKAGYIHNAALAVLDGRLDLASLPQQDDETVCQALCQLDGIGVWTAEMLMTFAMQRQDIMSYGDLAIQRGLRMLYHHRAIDRKRFDKYRRRYSPYGSVASLYLWAIAGGAIPGMKDYAPQKKAKTGGRQKRRNTDKTSV